MPVSESRRLHLFESAQASLGPDAAEALMDLLPTDPEQLATKADLRELRLATQADFADLRSETRTEIGGLRVELHRALAEQTRTLILAMIGFVLTATALAFAAVRLAR